MLVIFFLCVKVVPGLLFVLKFPNGFLQDDRRKNVRMYYAMLSVINGIDVFICLIDLICCYHKFAVDDAVS